MLQFKLFIDAPTRKALPLAVGWWPVIKVLKNDHRRGLGKSNP